MKSIFMLSSVFILSMSFSACSLKQQPNTSESTVTGNYQLPQEIYQGYWSLIGSINKEDIAVKFNTGGMEIHVFKCLPNGSFEKKDTVVLTYKPTKDAIGVVTQASEVYSSFKVMNVISKKSLKVEQYFPDSPSMIHNYQYSNTLKPLCK